MSNPLSTQTVLGLPVEETYDVVETKLREFVSDDLFVEEDIESAQQEHLHRE